MRIGACDFDLWRGFEVDLVHKPHQKLGALIAACRFKNTPGRAAEHQPDLDTSFADLFKKCARIRRMFARAVARNSASRGGIGDDRPTSRELHR